MKLEQTIQRSKKSSSGIIGQTRQIKYVSESEMVYHEVLIISNTYRDLITSNISGREYDLHQELTGNYRKGFNIQVKMVQ